MSRQGAFRFLAWYEEEMEGKIVKEPKLSIIDKMLDIVDKMLGPEWCRTDGSKNDRI